jgi:hypothetical protein
MKKNKAPVINRNEESKQADDLDQAEKPASVVAVSSHGPAQEKQHAVARELAASDVVLRNWKWPDADQDFPYEPQLRTVEKYYPLAKDGPLLVDEPSTESEMQDCERKRAAISRRGLRYVAIGARTDVIDAAQQLEAQA